MEWPGGFDELRSCCFIPEATVVESWSNTRWEIHFRRYLNDWEVDRLSLLLHEVSSFKGTSTPDAFNWKHATDGKFSVNRLYQKEVRKQPGGGARPWKQIWRTWASTKLKCCS